MLLWKWLAATDYRKRREENQKFPSASRIYASMQRDGTAEEKKEIFQGHQENLFRRISLVWLQGEQKFDYTCTLYPMHWGEYSTKEIEN